MSVLQLCLQKVAFMIVLCNADVSFQYICPDQISPANLLRNVFNVFSQFLRVTLLGWSSFYYSSLDFFMRMNGVHHEELI